MGKLKVVVWLLGSCQDLFFVFLSYAYLVLSHFYSCQFLGKRLVLELQRIQATPITDFVYTRNKDNTNTIITIDDLISHLTETRSPDPLVFHQIYLHQTSDHKHVTIFIRNPRIGAQRSGGTYYQH